MGRSRVRIKMMMTRRQLFMASLSTVALLPALRSAPAFAYEVTHSDDEWRKLLTPDQFAVLRKSATERPFTSPLLNEHREGTFACAGCDLGLFSSKTKFDSGTGWPSFWAPKDKAVETLDDHTFGMIRSAVSCRRCGGHLGHVFNDGPDPTGLRYCINGVSLKFVQGNA